MDKVIRIEIEYTDHLKRCQQEPIDMEKTGLTRGKSGRETAAAMADPFFPLTPVLLTLQVVLAAEFAASIICPTSS